MLGGITSPGVLGGDVVGAIGSNLVTGLQGKPLPTTAPTDGQLMQYSASAGKWAYIGVLSASAIPGLTGDVIKNDGSNATTVRAIRNYPVTASAPADNQFYRWSNSAGEWVLVTVINQEVLTGTLDGTNATFTVAHTPVPAAGLKVQRNGLDQFQGSGGDYTVSGNTVTFTTASIPQPGDVLTAHYLY
jgi:hypothetical protein